MEYIFRIFDFNIYDAKDSNDASSDDESNVYKDSTNFTIQMFGINEEKQTCSILVEDFKPFFYVCLLYTSPSPRD